MIICIMSWSATTTKAYTPLTGTTDVSFNPISTSKAVELPKVNKQANGWGKKQTCGTYSRYEKSPCHIQCTWYSALTEKWTNSAFAKVFLKVKGATIDSTITTLYSRGLIIKYL